MPGPTGWPTATSTVPVHPAPPRLPLQPEPATNPAPTLSGAGPHPLEPSGRREPRRRVDHQRHPAQPGHTAGYLAELARPAITAGSPAGGVVLDFCSGTATTGVAALELGRRYTGIELHPPDNAAAARRLAHHTGAASAAGRTPARVRAEVDQAGSSR